MTDSQAFLVSLLAGDWETAQGYALTWPQVLGVLFWYVESRECSLEKVLGKFLKVVEGRKIESVVGDKDEGKEGMIELMKLYLAMKEEKEISFMSVLDGKSTSAAPVGIKCRLFGEYDGVFQSVFTRSFPLCMPSAVRAFRVASEINFFVFGSA